MVVKVKSKSSMTTVGQTPEAVQSIAQPVKAKSQTQAITEELIIIHQRLMASEAFEAIKRLEELKKMLHEVTKESGADPYKPYVFKCDFGEVEFGPCTKSVEITDKPKMISLLGEDVFKAIAKVGVTDMKKYLSESEIETLSEKVPGSRSMKAVRSAE